MLFTTNYIFLNQSIFLNQFHDLKFQNLLNINLQILTSKGINRRTQVLHLLVSLHSERTSFDTSRAAVTQVQRFCKIIYCTVTHPTDMMKRQRQSQY